MKNRLPENPEEGEARGRFPVWLHRKLPRGRTLWQTGKVLASNRLHTVCEEARCPNLTECWSAKTATFLAMGKECTRSCGFCSIDFNKAPRPLDEDEPQRIVQSVQELELRHVVVTMVARDDLSDGGAAHLAAIAYALHEKCPGVSVEFLTSDFQGDFSAIDKLLEAPFAIYNYNIETVWRLSPRVRHKATYARTLALLRYIKTRKGALRLKSGLMVGLGETREEVFATLRDLKEVGCDIVTIGQYLQSDPKKLLVKSFVTPEEFAAYEAYGRALNIPHLYCGPFVRSSYNAAQFLQEEVACG
jgi:lipoic acid synthetase